MINGMKIQKARIFKFDERLVTLLTSNTYDDNINSKSQVTEIDNLKNKDTSIITDYKKKYEEAEEEIERLNEIMGALLAENVRYKSKYGDIDN